VSSLSVYNTRAPEGCNRNTSSQMICSNFGIRMKTGTQTCALLINQNISNSPRLPLKIVSRVLILGGDLMCQCHTHWNLKDISQWADFFMSYFSQNLWREAVSDLFMQRVSVCTMIAFLKCWNSDLIVGTRSFPEILIRVRQEIPRFDGVKLENRVWVTSRLGVSIENDQIH